MALGMKLMWLFTSIGLYTTLYMVFGAGSNSTFCKSLAAENPHINCASVMNSSYGKIFDVPVSIWGLCYFLIQVIILVAPKQPQLKQVALFFYSIIGSLFCLYFIYAEYILGSLCPLCTVVHVVTFAALFAMYPKGFSLSPTNILSILWVLKVYMLIAMIIVAIPLIFYSFVSLRQRVSFRGKDLIELAQCVKHNNVSMYGLRGCKFCNRQKLLLGRAFAYISYHDCREESDECNRYGITKFPTWLMSNGSAAEGMLNITELALFAGCKVPTPVNVTADQN